MEASPAAMADRGGGVGEIGAQARVLVCCGGKGEDRSLNAILNKAKGRKGKWKGTGRPANLQLMAGGPSGRKEGKGKGRKRPGIEVSDLLP
jgi:hypothetical protein